jgi:hypothetical protein
MNEPLTYWLPLDTHGKTARGVSSPTTRSDNRQGDSYDARHTCDWKVCEKKGEQCGVEVLTTEFGQLGAIVDNLAIREPAPFPREDRALTMGTSMVRVRSLACWERKIHRGDGVHKKIYYLRRRSNRNGPRQTLASMSRSSHFLDLRFLLT